MLCIIYMPNIYISKYNIYNSNLYTYRRGSGVGNSFFCKDCKYYNDPIIFSSLLIEFLTNRDIIPDYHFFIVKTILTHFRISMNFSHSQKERYKKYFIYIYQIAFLKE